MFENNLINAADIQGFKALSSNMNADKKINPFVLEAQEFELRPFLGDALYNELIVQYKNGFTNPLYADLWNGGTYTSGTFQMQNPGLKVVLVYYADARIISKSNTNSTATGMVSKNNNDSSHISEKTVSRLVSDCLSGAKSYENRVRAYLECKASEYPLLVCTKVNKRTGGFRISSVG